jgi:D-lyxose ketol-isomerase
VIGKLPASVGTARISYYKSFTPLENETDELPTSLKSYTSSFIDYATAQAFYLDNKDAKGDRFMNSANAKLSIFKDQITPRHMSGIKYVEAIEDVSAEEYLFW